MVRGMMLSVSRLLYVFQSDRISMRMQGSRLIAHSKESPAFSYAHPRSEVNARSILLQPPAIQTRKHVSLDSAL
jgi:hypothetical protein